MAGEATHAIMVLTIDSTPSDAGPCETNPTAMSPPITPWDAEMGSP